MRLPTFRNLSTHPNWATPADVKVSSPSFFIRTNGSTNIYSSTTSFGRGSLSQGDTVFYRWGKEIIRSDAINPWVWSEVSSFVVPAPLPPRPPRPPRPPPTSTSANTPNLLPALSTPVVLTRPIGPVIATTAGGMFRINDAFCGGLPPGIPAVVNVPNLTWGVAGVNIAAVTTGFDVQRIDATTNNPLDTLTLQNGFPANTPLVQRNNYPGRLTTIRVISNPTFQVGQEQQTFVGCFTQPGVTQTLDPTSLLIRVDPNNSVNEGDRENDNDLPF